MTQSGPSRAEKPDEDTPEDGERQGPTIRAVRGDADGESVEQRNARIAERRRRREAEIAQRAAEREAQEAAAREAEEAAAREAAEAEAAARRRAAATATEDDADDAEPGQPLRANVPALREAKKPPAPAKPAGPAPAPQPKPKPDAAAGTGKPVLPAAGPARLQGRHGMVFFSFLIMVALPLALSAWYLWGRAVDQYHSTVAFSVRAEEGTTSFETMFGVGLGSGSSTSDTDILYEFLQSQELVMRIDAELDLREIWSRADPEVDPIFAYDAPGTIEDLVDYWPRMVRIYYDSASGLIELRVLAFTPEDAHAIAEAIFAASSAMINEVSAIARNDAIGYARDELEQTQARLTEARVALTEFRNRTQIVDPTLDTQSQMGLVTTLQAQLAEALIELDVLRDTTREGDPRIAQIERRIAVIENRIEEERSRLGASSGEAFADLVGEYERLVVDQEFAEAAYTAALAALDVARNEARRQTRYLAAHVRPTMAESAQFPQRGTLMGVIGVFAFLIWSVVVLVGYALRDRR